MAKTRGLGLTTLFSAQTASGTTGRANCQANLSNLRFDVIGSGTLSTGVVTLECAHDVGYTGTWSAIYTVNAADVTGGAVKSVFVSGCFDAVGARISTGITGGGSVSVMVTGN